eukprot:364743-Chlamydomonas_euryale.AAC.50
MHPATYANTLGVSAAASRAPPRLAPSAAQRSAFVGFDSGARSLGRARCKSAVRLTWQHQRSRRLLFVLASAMTAHDGADVSCGRRCASRRAT